jgi:hypothetical protein
MRLLRYAPLDSSMYFKYASEVFCHKPCIHIRLNLLATNPCEKCGLGSKFQPLIKNVKKARRKIDYL